MLPGEISTPSVQATVAVSWKCHLFVFKLEEGLKLGELVLPGGMRHESLQRGRGGHVHYKVSSGPFPARAHHWVEGGGAMSNRLRTCGT